MRHAVQVWKEDASDVVVVFTRGQAQEVLAHAATAAATTRAAAELGDDSAVRRLPPLHIGLRAIDVALAGEDQSSGSGPRAARKIGRAKGRVG
jgi:hypothetical protein